jgi:hypothetical protein
MQTTEQCEAALKALKDEISMLNDRLYIAEETNKAHCTVIDDLQEGALAKFVKWLQRDYERRFSGLNDQTVNALLLVRDLGAKNVTLREEARRAHNELARFKNGHDGVLYEHDTHFGIHLGKSEYREQVRASKTHYYKIVKTVDHGLKETSPQSGVATGATEPLERDGEVPERAIEESLPKDGSAQT